MKLLVGVLTAATALPLHGVARQGHGQATSGEWYDHDSMCAQTAPPTHATNFSAFCAPGSTSCWPALWLLGVQKAATTSIADAMMQCGQIAYGMPSTQTGPLPNGGCSELGKPCKEVLHSPLTTAAGQIGARGKQLIPHLYDTTRCHAIKSVPGDTDDAASIPACQAGRFLEATPLGIGDVPTVAALLGAIPPAALTAARFAVIFREPVARMLSWCRPEPSTLILTDGMLIACE